MTGVTPRHARPARQLLHCSKCAGLALLDELGAQHEALDAFVAAVDFLIVAWSVFLLIKVLNALRRKEEAKTDKPA